MRITNKNQIFRLHFCQLVKKRLYYFRRDKRGFLCEILLPGLICAIGLAICLKKWVVYAKPVHLSPILFNLPINMIYSGWSSSTSDVNLMTNIIN